LAILTTIIKAQQILDEMQLEDFSDNPEIKSVIIRNPDQSLLIIRSQIPSLRVQSNNKILKSDHIDSGTLYLYLTPGTHRLIFQADAFLTAKKRLYLNPKEVKGINIRILPTSEKKLEKDSGIIVINSDPDSCRVFIDGEFYGTTPYIGKLINGQYRLTIEQHGFDIYEQVIIVVAGRTLAVNSQLSRPSSSYRKDENETELAQPHNVNKKSLYISPRIAFQTYMNGLYGAEILITKFGLNFGYFPMSDGDWTTGGIKYYFKSDQSSYYTGIGVGDREGYTHYGLCAGYNWIWNKKWNLTLGLGPILIIKDRNDDKKIKLFPLWEISFGYRFLLMNYN